jgi:hypothetical protein
MPLKRIEECTLDDLFGLFEMEELTLEELKDAKKKVLLLHPDKNIGRQTDTYYEYFKNAYQKLEAVFLYSNRHAKEVVSKTYQTEDLVEAGFYDYCKQKDLKDKGFQKVFNEVFDRVYLAEKDGHGEWLKEDTPYDKTDLEKSRQKAMSLVVVDREIRTLADMTQGDLKEAYLHTVLPIDAEQVLRDTPTFSSVDAYQRHRTQSHAPPISGKESIERLRKQETLENKTALQLSYEHLKKGELQSKKMKEVYREFLRIE